MSNPYKRPAFGSALTYQDPMKALDWLAKAFGFERTMLITTPDGSLSHAEMSFGNGYITIGYPWTDYTVSPKSVGGGNTQSLHVHLDGGLDEHCARAKVAGAVVLQEPEDQFYGDRTYRARDPEGHVWTFAQNIRAVTREEAEKASGLKIEGWL